MSRLQIALIRPDVPADFPLGRLKSTIPLGLLVLAGALRVANYDVLILDDHLEQKGAKWICDQLVSRRVDAVGITVNLATVGTTAEISGVVQKAGLPVFVGGPEVTSNLDYVLHQINPSFAVQGEGEETVVELLGELFGQQSYGSVPGLTFRRENSAEYITNELRPWINMDSGPILPYELLDLSRYDRAYAEFSSSKVEVLNTSRGCPFKCTFCSNKYVWSNKYRAMSPPRMLQHVRHALAETDATAIYFREDHFTLDYRRVEEFCKLVIAEGLHFEWGCESRVDNLTLEMLQLMYAAGLRSMWFGVESGSDAVLKKLNKGTTVAQVREAVSLCRRAGVKVGFSVMLGIPGESRDDLQQTLDLVYDLKPDWVYWAAFLGLPGSQLFKYIEDHPELIFQRWRNLILPHCDYMSYPEKLRLKQRMELKFNCQPRILFGHLKRMGFRRFVHKASVNFIRLLKIRFNPHNVPK